MRVDISHPSLKRSVRVNGRIKSYNEAIPQTECSWSGTHMWAFTRLHSFFVIVRDVGPPRADSRFPALTGARPLLPTEPQRFRVTLLRSGALQ